MAYKDLRGGQYYLTSVPDGASLPTFADIHQAVDEATRQVKADGKHADGRRYVVKIVAKVEPDSPPIKVTRYDE